MGEGVSQASCFETVKTTELTGSPHSRLLQAVLDEIGRENHAQRVGRRLDDARISYAAGTVRVKDAFRFNEAITAFYAHMLRHTGAILGSVNADALLSGAIDVVERAFSRQGGYNAAVAEGIHAINGGMRLVFDTITEYLKQDAKDKWIKKVFKEVVDPLEWDAKIGLMEAFLDLIGHELPAGLRDLPPKKLTRHLESILRAHADSTSDVAELLKRL
jgi:hypothetical protein